jgi:hypothetical protein
VRQYSLFGQLALTIQGLLVTLSSKTEQVLAFGKASVTWSPGLAMVWETGMTDLELPILFSCAPA